MPFGYKGYYEHLGGEHLWAHTRTYSTGAKQFTSADPLVGDAFVPLSMNSRRAFSGDPVNVHDRLGLRDESDGRLEIWRTADSGGYIFGFAASPAERLDERSDFSSGRTPAFYIGPHPWKFETPDGPRPEIGRVAEQEKTRVNARPGFHPPGPTRARSRGQSPHTAGDGGEEVGARGATPEPALSPKGAGGGDIGTLAGSFGMGVAEGWVDGVLMNPMVGGAPYLLYQGVQQLSGLAQIASDPSGFLDAMTPTDWARMAGNMVPHLVGGGVAGAKGAFCFAPDTEVATPVGSKDIEDLEIGDEVLAFNVETGELGVKKVSAIYKREVQSSIELWVAGEYVTTTAEHPFWVDGKGWTKAENLAPGDVLWRLDGGTVEVDDIVEQPWPLTVYNLEVDGFHTFYWLQVLGGAQRTENAEELATNPSFR